jgi:hypothetical protein
MGGPPPTKIEKEAQALRNIGERGREKQPPSEKTRLEQTKTKARGKKNIPRTGKEDKKKENIPRTGKEKKR